MCFTINNKTKFYLTSPIPFIFNIDKLNFTRISNNTTHTISVKFVSVPIISRYRYRRSSIRNSTIVLWDAIDPNTAIFKPKTITTLKHTNTFSDSFNWCVQRNSKTQSASSSWNISLNIFCQSKQFITNSSTNTHYQLASIAIICYAGCSCNACIPNISFNPILKGIEK